VFDFYRPVGRESRKGYAERHVTGFWDHYLKGPVVLDIGYRGDIGAVTIIDGAVGIEPGETPGYDGLHLPCQDGTVDAVHASHILEHVAKPAEQLAEWFRVLRVGGFLVLMVPHAYLYERRLHVPPSDWSGEHLHAFTPATLLTLIESTLAPNSYRVETLRDCAGGYNYALPRTIHPVGQFEIELVLCKIPPPAWDVL